jgi:ABC-type phosphate transport system substrate-binding protein
VRVRSDKGCSRAALGFATMLATLSPAGAAAQSALPFKVIVHADVAGARMPRQTLNDIFLGKATRWGDGTRIVPVDQSTTSAVRASFSKEALGQPVLAVQAYWAREISSGRGRPPAVKGSDKEVIRFVAATTGGIGYVSAETPLPPTVKVIEID